MAETADILTVSRWIFLATNVTKKLDHYKVIDDFGCGHFIFCSDAGLASENNRILNHTAHRAYIVTQSIKKFGSEYREAALDRKGFRRLSDHKPVNLDQLAEEDASQLFYKEEPYSSKQLEQRLLITYSPKYAAYQKEIREKQVARASAMLKEGKHKKTRKIQMTRPGLLPGPPLPMMGGRGHLLFSGRRQNSGRSPV